MSLVVEGLEGPYPNRKISYNQVMETLQRLMDGTLRMGSNTTEDLQQLFQRPLGAANILTSFRDVEVSAFSEKTLKTCFADKRRYPRGFDTKINDTRYISWPDSLPGQLAGKVRVFKMNGMANHAQLAAELLGVSDETSVSWLQQLLVRRGHTLTLPVIEGIIELERVRTDIGLAPRPNPISSSHHCNLAFVEVQSGIAKTVDVVYFSRQTPTRWSVCRYPFSSDGESCMNDHRLVIRV